MIKRNLFISAFLGTLLLSGQELVAFATDSHQASAVAIPGDVPDTVLADKAETLLRTDVGLVGSQFRVHSKSGILTITGSVPNEHALRRALDLVSGLHGVREIRNAMEIDAPK